MHQKHLRLRGQDRTGNVRAGTLTQEQRTVCVLIIEELRDSVCSVRREKLLWVKLCPQIHPGLHNMYKFVFLFLFF